MRPMTRTPRRLFPGLFLLLAWAGLARGPSLVSAPSRLNGSLHLDVRRVDLNGREQGGFLPFSQFFMCDDSVVRRWVELSRRYRENPNGPRVLPIVKVGDEHYFVDERLRQLRNVTKADDFQN